MKTGLALLCLIFISCSSKLKQDMSLFKKEMLEAEGVNMPYRILLPRDYDSSKSYPLILVLHGAGERGDDNESQLSHGADLFLQENIRTNYPSIVVFPQCPEEDYWANVKRERNLVFFDFTFYPNGQPTKAMINLQHLYRFLIETYKVDMNQIYIGGLSMGAMGTFEFVRRNPNTVAAAFAICGGAHPDTATQLTGNSWWVFHGDSDMVVDYEHSVAMVSALKDAGAEVKFTTYEGVNHDSWENAFAEPELIPWLFSKQLKR